ncbi:putative RING-type zinc-finger [Lyophyllum shimeji]|uniref:RING-type zinc-finger n=1 Tax=Lyophyllum shimeji TaxID=47721 RepID=A0A9P3PUW5_LYOSH|nr:putative RING-type zinc-finger [Lyophyllum shimeji]
MSAEHGRRDTGKGVDRSATSSSHLHTRIHLVEPQEPLNETLRDKHHDRPDRHSYSGPLAHAEFERMRKEIEAWKKAAADHKKASKKQAKKIEELKAQVLAETLAKKEQEQQVLTLKAKVEKKEELITTIENSLQCQICMDLLHQPYALSPCGHILCLLCLQEWFRKAPPSANDSDIDDDERDAYILTRSKSCPCCRAVVTRRPVPVFLVKAVATALFKYKAGTGEGHARRSPSPDGNDPWKGLFPASDEEDEGDSDSSEEDDDEYEDALGWAMHGLEAGLVRGALAHRLMTDRRYVLRYDEDDYSSIDSGGDDDGGVYRREDDDDDDDDEDDEEGPYSEDEDGYDIDENVYVPAQWEPPSVTVDPEDYVFRNEGVAASTLRMLRRGCTLDMIRIFSITYSHNRGLVAHLHSLDEIWPYPDNGLPGGTMPRNNRVFLGWNIKLDPADHSGEAYMQEILSELKENPARWTWAERSNVRGAYDVKRLVRMEEVEDYDTTDTEVWLDAHDPY